jgi:hypothetical protein
MSRVDCLFTDTVPQHRYGLALRLADDRDHLLCREPRYGSRLIKRKHLKLVEFLALFLALTWAHIPLEGCQLLAVR